MIASRSACIDANSNGSSRQENGMANASGISIMATAALKEAFRELVPQFERSRQCSFMPRWMPTVDMLRQLDGGEVVDLILLTGETIDALTGKGIVAPGSRTDVMKSSVGMAVRAGAPKPDIHTAEAFKQSMLAARSIAYSFGPSGEYIAELLQRLGIAGELGARARQVKGVPIGELVAKGEAELGFQQVSELLPVAGIDLLGALPAGIEKTTVFSTGLHRAAPRADIAREFVRYLVSAEAAPVMRRTGLEPLTEPHQPGTAQ
jgi:molybdate transport system substrate-binding protein